MPALNINAGNQCGMFGRHSPHTDTTVPYIPTDPQGIMAALLRTPPPPPSDEITERLSQQTTARVKESRKLLAALKRKLKRKNG